MQKDENKEPLLSNEEEQDLAKYSFGASISTIGKLAVMPIIGMIFHPMY